MPRLLFRLRLIALALLLALPVAGHAQGALSPSQAAFLKAENKRIEDYFVARVARIVGVSSEQVRRAMPDERRITVAASRLISALEQDLGRSLDESQRAAIIEADNERKRALARVREGASQR